MKNFSLFRWTSSVWKHYRLPVLLLLNAVLLVVFGSIIWVDNALNRGIDYTPDPEPIPWADGPRVGVNLYNLHLEPDPAVVTHTLELARSLGVRYIRMQMPWEDVEIHGRGDFTDRRNIDTVGVVSAWAKYDRIVDTAESLGLELVLRLDRPPDWAREVNRSTPFFQEGLAEDPTSTGPPDDFVDYGRFVHAVVSRYRGKVRFFQLWNEPNLKNEWNWHVPDPASFEVLLREGYEAAKRANPEAVIIFPSLAPVDGLDKRAPMTELEYLDGFYRAGGDDVFDIMSVQAYGLGQPPDEHRYVRLRLPGAWKWWQRPVDTRVDVSRVVLLREIMERHGDEDKPVWIGEFGWNSAPESIPEERRQTWGEPVSEQQKADYIIGYIERARQEWPWMGVMYIWNLRHGGYMEPDPADPTPYFALVGRDWTLLPAYTQLQAYLAQPAIAGLGAHTWQHPAVESVQGGWRLRFRGQQASLIGGLAGEVQARLDGAATALEREEVNGQPVLSTLPGTLDNSTHTLDIIAPGAAPPSHFVIAREPPLPLWLWTLLPLLVVVLLLASVTATIPLVFTHTHTFLARTPPARLGWRVWLATPGGERFLLLGMLAGVLIFYGVTTDLPTRVIGVALFGLCALVRPDLALLYVPLTVPLFFMPKGIWDDRFGLPEGGRRIPLHEMVLLVTLAATLLRGGVEYVRSAHIRQRFTAALRQHCASKAWWLAVAPVVLFLVAGTTGVLIVAPEGRSAALREWRWLIVEPLMLYGLLHYHGMRHQSREQRMVNSPIEKIAGISGYQHQVIMFLMAGGALVGLLGMLQFLGVNLVPLVGDKVTFAEDQVVTEGVRRVTSVYGHPNNLGLYMGRIWPLAFVVMAAAFVAQRRSGALTQDRAARSGWYILRLGWRVLVRYRVVLFSGVCFALSAGGLLVSFSKGAWLGAAVAAIILWMMLQSRAGALSHRQQWMPGATRFSGFLVGLALIGISLLVVILVTRGIDIERLNPFGESSSIRLKLWASSLAMIRDYPVFGIGLDQFLVFYQQGYIHSSLAETNERFTSHPHNMVLDVWLRLGIPGVIAFGWLLVRFFRRVWQRAPERLLCAGLAAVMAAALVHGMVDNFYFVPDLACVFWVLVWLGEV